MSKRKKDDELISFLSPVTEMWENNSDKNFDQASKEWQHILQSTISSPAPSAFSKSLVWRLFYLIIFSPLKSILNWFDFRMIKNNIFEKRTLKRLKKLDLIRTDQKGTVTLLPAPIDPVLGKALVCVLSSVLGIWMGWIIFGTSIDLKIIFNSFVAGIVIGTLISLINDLSYDQKKMYEKLRDLKINP